MLGKRGGWGGRGIGRERPFQRLCVLPPPPGSQALKRTGGRRGQELEEAALEGPPTRLLKALKSSSYKPSSSSPSPRGRGAGGPTRRVWCFLRRSRRAGARGRTQKRKKEDFLELLVRIWTKRHFFPMDADGTSCHDARGYPSLSTLVAVSIDSWHLCGHGELFISVKFDVFAEIG